MGVLDLHYWNDSTQQWEAPLANGVDLDALAIKLTQHENDASNPHKVSKSQVGLGDVDNVSVVSLFGNVEYMRKHILAAMAWNIDGGSVLTQRNRRQLDGGLVTSKRDGTQINGGTATQHYI